MSHNTTVELEIRDVALLQKALVDALGLTLEEVEVHTTPVEITDYYNREKRQVHVVLRKDSLRRAFGQGFSDAGFFLEPGGKAVLHHDDMDTKFGASIGRIRGQYARHTVLDQARRRGKRVTETLVNGKLQIKVS